MPRTFNNKKFIERFNHVEPYIMTTLQLTEAFNHTEPPGMILTFTEGFDS